VIGLDTNVLVRYITQDDAKQAALANRLIEGLDEKSPGFVTLVTVIELNWVLETSYQFSRQQFTELMQTLLAVEAIKLDRAAAVASALRIYSASKADFSDCLIERLSVNAGCERTVTFDRAAAKLAGMTLIKSVKHA
jgi:predicted nucleic-acid-binding protein